MIGAVLVQEGLATEQQLEHALRLQRRAGMRLGTNLLEAGAVEESDLLRLLGERHYLATASASDLEEVPLAVRKAIPRALAIEHSLVPYAVRGTAISIAAMAPIATEVEQEISDATSWWIRPAVAVEVRVLQALHRYYGFPMSARTRMIVETLDSPRPARPATEPATAEPRTVRPNEAGALDSPRPARPAIRPGALEPERIRSEQVETKAVETSNGTRVEAYWERSEGRDVTRLRHALERDELKLPPGRTHRDAGRRA